jgi:type III secretion protein V
VHQLRERLFDELGVPLPAPRLRLIDGMPPRHVVLLLFEVPALVLELPEDLAPDDAAATVAESILEVLRGRAADFFGLHEAQMLLDQLEQVTPALVRQVVPKPVPLPLLADVLRRLIEERVSVRDLRAILEALALHAPQERDPLALAELLRGHFRRATTYRLTGGAAHLALYLLDGLIEDTIRGSITRTPAGSFLTLSPAAARDIVASVRATLRENPPPEDAPLVVLTQPDIRRFVRKLLETDFPQAQVISFAELQPEVQLRPIARVLPRE